MNEGEIPIENGGCFGVYPYDLGHLQILVN